MGKTRDALIVSRKKQEEDEKSWGGESFLESAGKEGRQRLGGGGAENTL